MKSKFKGQKSKWAGLRWMIVALLLTFDFLLLTSLGGCKSGPAPVYEGVGGTGRLRYDPARGIVREGTQATAGEQKLFEFAQRAFEQRRFDECVEFCIQLTITYPDGARAVDAILMRMAARIEGNRNPEEGPSDSVSLAGWMFTYLTPSYDPRFRALVAAGGDVVKKAAELRKLTFEEFIAWIAPDAIAIHNGRAIRLLLIDLKLLVTYYLPALEVADYRLRTAEMGRDVAWIAYAARDWDYVIEACAELNSLNPPPGIKGDALFVQGNSEAKNGAHPVAANTFERLYRGANLHDTDTPWRPYALYQFIVQTANTAKGPEYDLAVYERCLELFGDYELYLLENASVPKALRQKFRVLIQEIYQVFIDRDLSAAKTYRKLNETVSAEYYENHAEVWRAQMNKRLEFDASRP